MSGRNGGRAGWNSSSLKRDLGGSIQVRGSSSGARGRRRNQVAGRALAAAGIRSTSATMDSVVVNQPYPDRLASAPTKHQHFPPQPQQPAAHTTTHSFYTSAPTDAPSAPASQRHIQYSSHAGGYQGSAQTNAPPKHVIGSRKRSSSNCSLPPPTPPAVPSTPVRDIRGASPMRRSSTSGTVGGSIVQQHQSAQKPTYDKYNYSILRDSSPMRSVRGASPHKSTVRDRSPSRRLHQPAGPSETVELPPAPTSDAWERLVGLARDDFSPEELAMLYWDTLSRLLNMYGVTEPMEVARIEITWKEIQAVRSTIDNPTTSHPQQQQVIVVPPPGPGRGSRDTNTKQSYTPFTYTVKRDTVCVSF